MATWSQLWPAGRVGRGTWGRPGKPWLISSDLGFPIVRVGRLRPPDAGHQRPGHRASSLGTAPHLVGLNGRVGDLLPGASSPLIVHRVGEAASV